MAYYVYCDTPVDKDALIHYDQGFCILLPTGIHNVEKNIELIYFSE